MAKNHSWDGNVLTFTTPTGEKVTVDVEVLPTPIVSAMLKFAAPTLLRNATAGLATEDPPKATERVKGRIAAWLAGNWSAKGEASAEPRSSLLARAFAEALGIDASEAAKRIETAIEASMAAQNPPCDPDSDDDAEKTRCRQVGTGIRKLIRESAEVLPIYQRLQQEAAKAAADKSPKVSLANIPGLMG